MSRVGKAPIVVPDQVKVEIQGKQILVEGPKGKLSHQLPVEISCEKAEGNQLHFKRSGEEKRARSMHGLHRTLVDNMVRGVTEGFVKALDLVGVGFKAQLSKNRLELFVGFTHPVHYTIPEGITVEIPKPTQLVIRGVDKYLVGQVAARIRAFAPPEPYKGKGIKYVGEQIRRKAGKSVG